MIGCIVLSQPVFFRPEDWIDAANFWSGSIVQGKSYDTTQADHARIWEQVQLRLDAYPPPGEAELVIDPQLVPAYTFGQTKIRKGQAAFRVDVLDAYGRRCAMTGEKTLPVLEAAHIQDYAAAGPNITANGLLLRSDLHKLFDRGYLTVTTDYRIEVSSRIREEFQNGKEYYKLHGMELINLPEALIQKPSTQFLAWHNEQRYRG
jgi:putative restriction endonuclease